MTSSTVDRGTRRRRRLLLARTRAGPLAPEDAPRTVADVVALHGLVVEVHCLTAR